MSEKDDRCAVCNMPRSDHKVFSHHCPKGHWDFAETTFVEPVASPQATRPECLNNCILDEGHTGECIGAGTAQPAAGTPPTVTGHEEFEHTDTQEGMSSEALGQQFQAYFQPAPSEGTTPQAERLDFLHDGKWHTRARCCNNGFMYEEHDCLTARAVAPVETPKEGKLIGHTLYNHDQQTVRFERAPETRLTAEQFLSSRFEPDPNEPNEDTYWLRFPNGVECVENRAFWKKHLAELLEAFRDKSAGGGKQ